MKGSSDEPVAVRDWGIVMPGDVVRVLARGESYVATVEMKTAQSDIIWVRRHGLGTRHLLDLMDNVQLQMKPQGDKLEGVQQGPRSQPSDSHN